MGFTTVGGVGIALLGKRATHRDVEIGSILAFALGLGVLFISLYTGYATEAYSILFGEILGISVGGVIITLVVSIDNSGCSCFCISTTFICFAR